MKINKPLFELLIQFNSNWERYQRRLCLNLSEEAIDNIENHPLSGELINLINGKGGSLPYFTTGNIAWCTMAANASLLKKEVEHLQAWIIPSYGMLGNDDGYKTADPSGNILQRLISETSKTNYFRWQSEVEHYSIIERKLGTRYQLEKKRPERNHRTRPSLYELRTQYQTALILGDRSLACKAIELIDLYELDKAINTQMMRIRLWHHFREFDCIRNFRNLPNMRAQPSLPNIINECIKEAIGEVECEIISTKELDIQLFKEGVEGDWESWFAFFIDQKDPDSARNWLENKKTHYVERLKQNQIIAYSERWDSLFVSDGLVGEHKELINEAIIAFFDDFVREPEYPRIEYARLYLSLLRLWGEMHAGISRGREEGHVLLELASALLKLNHDVNEVKSIIEEWWDARPVPSQLPFALDAIEMLRDQHPDRQAAENLWFGAINLIKRNPDQLLESEKSLWRSVGLRIGLEDADIKQYLPLKQEVLCEDLLASSNLIKIAIICMRERQAQEAARLIQERTKIDVLIVSSKVSGKETDQACSCDVVLFVWMASTHAVFRAFDKYDRHKLCYVQGTGSASIVRALERWCKERSS